MKKIVFIWTLLLLLVGNGELLLAGDGDWRKDFDKICARTAEAGKLNSEELSRLIAESDELLKVVGASADPDGKIYLIRLKKCRNFFVFMRQTVENSKE
jgi:hypothetical protein